jgi:hypothetical protein
MYYGSTPLTQPDDPPTSFRHEFIPSGDLLHSHGSHGPFIDDVSIKASIYKGFSMAMLNNQMVNGRCEFLNPILYCHKNRLVEQFFPENHPVGNAIYPLVNVYSLLWKPWPI